MNINNIIKDLNYYKKNRFESKFINKIITYFNKYENNKLISITENKLFLEFELAGIKIHLLYNNYKFILSNNILEGYTYRKIILNQKQLNNLYNQKYGLDKNTFKICEKITKKLENPYYLIIIHDNKYFNNFINYDFAIILLGIESLNFLNHQNLDNYCSDILLKNSDFLFIELSLFKKILNKMSLLERDNIIIFSGIIYQFLGTFYTKDIDMLILYKNEDEKNKYVEYFKELKNIDISYLSLTADNDKYYVKQWFLYKLPQLGGAKDLFTMLINPKYHFYFMGIKCFDIFTTFKRTSARTNAMTINDIILLNKINNLNYYDKFCLKNFNIRQGKARIFTDTIINSVYNNVIKVMKEWWNIDITLEYLVKHFIKCDKMYNTIFYNKINSCDKYIKKILKYNKFIMENIITKYINSENVNNKSIFDYGFGLMPYLKLYNKLKINKVFGIEMSLYSFNNVIKKIRKYNNINFNLIYGLHDNISNDITKVDLIIFNYSIQYLLPNSEKIIIDNLNKLSKKNSIIIISYFNGTKILANLKKNNQIEINYNNDIFLGFYKFNDVSLNKILIYMKDVYGLENGSEEYLIKPENLIQLFTQNNYKFLEKISFLDEYINQTKFKKFKLFQKEILSYYEILIFQKNI